MKLHVLSDLHLEFAPLPIPDVGADVVVLAGDIDVGTKGVAHAIDALGGRRAIYVAGNHEYYGHAVPALTDAMRALAHGSNVAFLEQDQVVVDGVRFLGCTLWTDFAAFGAARSQDAQDLARFLMTDYRRIRTHHAPDAGDARDATLTPADTIAIHERARAWLDAKLREPFAGKTVVVTHHAPTLATNDPKYANELLSAAFVSDLSPLLRGDRVAVWIHGHTHHCADVTINGTRVVSNQRGYHPSERVAGFDPRFVVDL